MYRCYVFLYILFSLTSLVFLLGFSKALKRRYFAFYVLRNESITIYSKRTNERTFIYIIIIGFNSEAKCINKSYLVIRLTCVNILFSLSLASHRDGIFKLQYFLRISWFDGILIQCIFQWWLEVWRKLIWFYRISQILRIYYELKWWSY